MAAIEDRTVDRVRVLIDGTLLITIDNSPFHAIWGTSQLPEVTGLATG